MDPNSYPILHKQNQTYDGFLEPRKYICSLQQGIIKITDESMKVLSEDALSGKWKLTDEILKSDGIVSFDLTQLSEGINSLKADFNIAMGGVLVNFEMTRKKIRAGFDKIIETFQQTKKMEDENHFRESLKFYRDASRTLEQRELITSSLRQMVRGIEQHRRNPVAYLHLGHIYHYQKEHRNFKKAFENYTLCYTLAMEDETQHPVAAQGMFYAGWLSAAVFGNIQGGIDMTQKALEIDPGMAEAHYHLAKLFAAFGDTKNATTNLREAITSFDRRYCRKIELDSDFAGMKADIKKLFHDVAEEDLSAFENAIQDGSLQMSNVLKMHAHDKLEHAKHKLETDDYLAYEDVIMMVQELKLKVEEENKPDKLTPEQEQEIRRKEEAQRIAEEEAEKKAIEEKRLQAELKAKMESAMKQRMAIQQEKRRQKNVLKAIISNLVFLFLASSVASFLIFGGNVWGFGLALLSCLSFLALLLVN